VIPSRGAWSEWRGEGKERRERCRRVVEVVFEEKKEKSLLSWTWGKRCHSACGVHTNHALHQISSLNPKNYRRLHLPQMCGGVESSSLLGMDRRHQDCRVYRVKEHLFCSWQAVHRPFFFLYKYDSLYLTLVERRKESFRLQEYHLRQHSASRYHRGARTNEPQSS